MDMEQEKVQVLSFIGILIESFKIILSRPKLFSKITLTFILPFNFFILLASVNLKLIVAEVYNNNSSITSIEEVNLFSNKLIIYYCIGTICIITIQTLHFFFIAAVVYSTGCIYTSKDINFQKLLRVARKVRVRLTIISTKYVITTYVYDCVITVGILVSNFGFFFGFFSTTSDAQFKTWILKIIFVILIVSVEIYMIICMQLVNVITIIEDVSWSEAKEKSSKLMKGNNGIAIAISLVLFLCYTPMFVLAQQLIGVDSSNIGLGSKILYGITSMVLNPMIIICGWVAPTMLYFVCKLYHGESIDISSFNDCFDVSSKLNGDGDYYVALENEGDEKIDKLDV